RCTSCSFSTGGSGGRGAGPLLRGVKHRDDFEAFSFHAIGEDAGGAADNQLPSSEDPAWPAHVRHGRKRFDRLEDAGGHVSRCLGVLLGDEAAKSQQVFDSPTGPDYLHRGGGNSASLPQERSHAATRSPLALFPELRSARPAFTCLSCHSCESR